MLYGYGASRTRNRSDGRRAMARTTRLNDTVCDKQRVMVRRKYRRDMPKTKSAPSNAGDIRKDTTDPCTKRVTGKNLQRRVQRKWG